MNPNNFYNSAYRDNRYSTFYMEEDHYAAADLNSFLQSFELSDKRCLEVGSGRGAFQDIIPDYTGTDLSDVVAENYHKPFFTANAEDLPFDDHAFDAIWTITVLEHVPNPEKALREIRRVLKPQGLLCLKPAWNCRPWICEGIPVRQYKDLTIRQRLIKLSLPIRDSVAFRAAHTLPRRLFSTCKNFVAGDERLRYRKLRADYETFWMVDSDACSSMIIDSIRPPQVNRTPVLGPTPAPS